MKKLIPLAIVLLGLSAILTACWAEDDSYYEGTEEANSRATEATEEYGEAATCSDDSCIIQCLATEIGEDIAESFESFVVQPMPTGDTVPEQKILFFYQFPELVDLRQTMIQGMCNFQG